MFSKSTLYILILSAAVGISCSNEKKDVVFSLEGKLNSSNPDHALLYQAKGLNANEFDVVDTLTVQADSTFSASYSLEPHFYQLRISDYPNVSFIADSGQNIAIQYASDEDYDLSGSPDTNLFEEYEEYRMNALRELVYPVRDPLDSLLAEDDPENAERIEQLGKEVLKAEESYRDTLLYAVQEMGTSIAIYPTMVRWDGDKHMDYYEGLAADFSEEHAGLEVAELVSEKVRILEQVSIGGKVSEIVAPDTSGVERSLYNNLGTYTLIDFFGSWCGPCRSESDHLGRMYSQYKDAGFEIFGFGVEFEKESWLRAIEKDNRSWINVSTVDGYTNQIAAEYSITALPKNFLVDEDGIIIAKDIHGEELEEKLDELFPDE
ncbi:TlpA disulfide reductase family protein [Rhodohalobacter sp.]|uniref:peroxiredoxin family protein n=1 Tax=Rhodohalobacter sp. TaxID=1974210 RepID=UPI002ACE8095|nr:TlpA disulfide reductase family protein [Rhodohalobacter sp.]MDZ7756004.1 TlpA disulfide reductase family protein [Rhodohalobacter sp.]